MVLDENNSIDRFNTGILKRFELEGFRNLGLGAGINIKQLNLFVGPNGSGKSTVLSAFQLFHVAILERKIQRIDAGLVDRFGLLTQQERPFTARLVYQKATFEYEYEIDERFNWVCTRMSLFVGEFGGDRNELVEFHKGGEQFEIHRVPASTFLRDVGAVRGGFIGVEGEELASRSTLQLEHQRREALLAEEVIYQLNRLSNQGEKQGELNISNRVEFVVDEFVQHDEVLSLLTGDEDNAAHLHAYPALEKLLIWLSSFNEVSYHTPWSPEYKLLCRPLITVSAGHCPDAVRAAYKSFGIDPDESCVPVVYNPGSDEYQVEHAKLLSNVKKLIANIIITEGYESNKDLAKVLEMLMNENESDENTGSDFLSALQSKGSFLHWTLISLLNGCSDRSHGLLPPHDEDYWLLSGERKVLRGAFNHINTLASEYSVGVSLSENKELRSWVFARLSEKGRVNLNIPEVKLGCGISFDRTGKLSIRALKNGDEVPLEGLSRGEQKLLLIALYREFDSFLEEPESNLHPSYQSILGRLISSGYVSMAGVTENEFEYDDDLGFVDLEEPDEEVITKKFVWKYGAHRDYQFIETHSDILIKAIQLEMARNLPKPALWEEHPGLTPSFKEVQKQFAELDPNIEVTYFGTVNGKSVPKSMGLRRDGVFREEFGPGFYDESLQLVRDIFDLKSQN